VLPVRSAVLKRSTGGLVVRWVTTSEYPLLYVFDFLAVVGIESGDGWVGESGVYVDFLGAKGPNSDLGLWKTTLMMIHVHIYV
jgi:hypothetical protein